MEQTLNQMAQDTGLAFKIAKNFSISYAHRLPDQSLDPELSLHAPCKCKNLHGHNAEVTLHIEQNEPLKNGMVFDYTNLSKFKSDLNNRFDHAAIFKFDDPYTKFALEQSDKVVTTTNQPTAEIIALKILALAFISIPDGYTLWVSFKETKETECSTPKFSSLTDLIFYMNLIEEAV